MTEQTQEQSLAQKLGINSFTDLVDYHNQMSIERHLSNTIKQNALFNQWMKSRYRQRAFDTQANEQENYKDGIVRQDASDNHREVLKLYSDENLARTRRGIQEGNKDYANWRNKMYAWQEKRDQDRAKRDCIHNNQFNELLDGMHRRSLELSNAAHQNHLKLLEGMDNAVYKTA